MIRATAQYMRNSIPDHETYQVFAELVNLIPRNPNCSLVIEILSLALATPDA